MLEEFIRAELSRFAEDPIMRLIGYATGISMIGLPMMKRFSLDLGFSQQTVRLVRYLVGASVIALSVTLFRSNTTAHVVAFLAGQLIVYSIIFEKWKILPDAGLGFVGMLLVYNGFSIALAGENEELLTSFLPMISVASLVSGVFFAILVVDYRQALERNATSATDALKAPKT